MTVYTLKTWTGVSWGTVRNVLGIGEAVRNAETWARRVGIPARIEVGGFVVYEVTPRDVA